MWWKRSIHRITLAVGFIAAVPLVAQAVPGDGYRKAMHIAFSSYGSNEMLTNFPALIVLSNGMAKGVFDYRQFLSPPNADLRFADGQGAELNYEIDTWNTGGMSYVWVQVPRLCRGTAITCFWSKAGVTAPVCTTNGATWGEGYVSVHHLGSATSARDSAAHGYDGTPMNMAPENLVTGMIGNALAFNRSDEGNEHVRLPSGYRSFSNGITVSAWVNFTRLGLYSRIYQSIIALGIRSPGFTHLIWVGSQSQDRAAYAGKGYARAYVGIGNASDYREKATARYVYGQDQWVNVVVTCTKEQPGGCVACIYKDGSLVDTVTGFITPGNIQRTRNYIGLDTDGYYLMADLDEVQVADVERSAAWVQASYLNQVNNARWFAVCSPAYRLVLDITNEPGTVPYEVTTVTIAGTNSPLSDATNGIAGSMWWTNECGTGVSPVAGTLPATSSWTIADVPLAYGANCITVRGTNELRWTGADRIVVSRTPPFFLDITNANMTVGYNATSCAVAGTNTSDIAGGMWVSNVTIGGTAARFARSGLAFAAPPVALAIGTNVIMVYGTNVLGFVSADRVVVATAHPRESEAARSLELAGRTNEPAYAAALRQLADAHYDQGTYADAARLYQRVAAIVGRKRDAGLPHDTDQGGSGFPMDMVEIRPGMFSMGEGAEAHQVTISQSFRVGRCEVTRRQFGRFLDDIAFPREGEARERPPADDVPMVNVSWSEAKAFCRWLTLEEFTAGRLPEGCEYRLPTEAEWEYACRAGSAAGWCFGDDPKLLDGHAWHSGNSDNAPHPVGRKKANPWGVHDMHGNVWEWCEDWYGQYAKGSQTHPHGPEKGDYRVLRGGAWDSLPDFTRSAYRGYYDPGVCAANLGFRVVCAPRP